MIPYILLVLILCYFIAKKYRSYVVRKYELKLYALRDDLRQLAIEKKIDSKGWFFDYLDSSISIMTYRFQIINIFHAMRLAQTHRADYRFLAFKRQLDIQIKKNAELERIYKSYQSILRNYMFEKHLILITVIVGSIYSVFATFSKARKIKSDIADSVRSLSIYPETSTSENHYLAKAAY